MLRGFPSASLPAKTISSSACADHVAVCQRRTQTSRVDVPAPKRSLLHLHPSTLEHSVLDFPQIQEGSDRPVQRSCGCTMKTGSTISDLSDGQSAVSAQSTARHMMAHLYASLVFFSSLSSFFILTLPFSCGESLVLLRLCRSALQQSHIPAR